MSVFRRRAAAVTAIATAALAGGSLLLPAVANAAPASAQAATTPLSIVTSVPQAAAPLLLRGAGTATVTFTVHNNTGRAVSFKPMVLGDSHGVIPINSNEVVRTVQTVHAPATRLVEAGYDGMIADTLAPAGKPAGTEFSIPARASYSWKLNYSVKTSFPANDPDLDLGFRALGGPLNASLAGSGSSVDLGIAVGHSRPFAEFLSGGDTVAPGKPLLFDLNMSNYTGAAVHGTFTTQFSSAVAGYGTGAVERPLLALDAWENGHWVTLQNEHNEDAWKLPSFTGSIANGADRLVPLRLRVLNDSDAAATTQVSLTGMTSLGNGNSAELLSGFQFDRFTVVT